MATVTCLASNFNIIIKEDSNAYLNDVEIVYKREGRVDEKLTDQFKNRTKATNKFIVKSLQELRNVPYVYDSMKQLWTPEKIGPITVEILKEELPQEISDSLRENGIVSVKITPKEDQPLNLTDYSQYDQEDYWMNEDRTLRNILELITSHGALENGFCQIKNGRFFGPEEPFHRGGLVVRSGCQKGVQCVKYSTNGSIDENKVKFVLIMDVKKKVFYPSNKNLLELFDSLRRNQLSLQDIEILLKGVRLYSVYNPSRTLIFKNFGLKVKDVSCDIQKCNCRKEKRIPQGEQCDCPKERIQLTKYYYNTYNQTLKRLDSLVAVMSNVNGDFPPELLHILPDQEVPTFQLPFELENEQKRLNLMKPNIRYEEILSVIRKLKLNNPTSQAFGVRVEEEMVRVECESLRKPEIQASERLTPDPEKGTFRFERNTNYSLPSKFQKWAVLAPKEKGIKEFCEVIRKSMFKRGVKLPDGTFEECNPGLEPWKESMEKLKKKGINYFFVIGDTCYSELKLIEEYFIRDIVTQNVNLDTFEKIINNERGSGQIVENICFKFNIKSGGLNHIIKMDTVASKLDLSSGKVLVIGLDVNHPTGNDNIGKQTQPSVVGFTANYGENPHAFMGDFFFQKPRNEKIDPEKLQKYVEKIFEKFQKSQKSRNLPEFVGILRDGVSEGQYSMLIQEEFAAIRKAALKFTKTPPKFILIVLTKRHNTRHFLKVGSRIESLVPGSFINEGTRKNLVQFYFAAHKAIQGSCQDILVTVLVNDPGITQETAKQFIHGLCYLHQICTSPISLPEPVYQADNLAERGMLVYKAAKEKGLVNANDDFDLLDSKFSYGKGNLPDVRFTA
ncbi:hypothetical protein FO519_006993 [Halicephalobus sp. NKZ332]|nr:hypothetical protein FO519_006993 [Halicephalobus sp. NKZ332]